MALGASTHRTAETYIRYLLAMWHQYYLATNIMTVPMAMDSLGLSLSKLNGLPMDSLAQNWGNQLLVVRPYG